MEDMMSKDISISNPDAALLAIFRQHSSLWREWGHLDDDDPRTAELSDRCADLEFETVLMPAHTRRGLACKRLVMMRRAQLHDGHGFFEWVLARDAERLAAR
jgi:hypothetical protein